MLWTIDIYKLREIITSFVWGTIMHFYMSSVPLVGIFNTVIAELWVCVFWFDIDWSMFICYSKLNKRPRHQTAMLLLRNRSSENMEKETEKLDEQNSVYFEQTKNVNECPL